MKNGQYIVETCIVSKDVLPIVRLILSRFSLRSQMHNMVKNQKIWRKNY